MDPILAQDIYERLYYYPNMERVELILPKQSGKTITVDDIDTMALDTRSSSVIIMDIRHQTLTRLMQVYGKIVRFNRPDFNTYCYSVVIGDGPRGMLNPDVAMGAYQKYLADVRIDYSPGVFFVDPFLNYSHEEMQELVLYEGNAFPRKLPEQIGKYFKNDEMTVEQARSYFRAAEVEGQRKGAVRKRRQIKLAKYYNRMLDEIFSSNAEQMKRSLCKNGCSMPGEALNLNVYPFFFEQWVRYILEKATVKIRTKHTAESQPDFASQVDSDSAA